MKSVKKMIMVLGMLIAVFALGIPSLDTRTVEAAKIKINKKKATLTVGKTLKLKVKKTKKKVKWSSSNKNVATVSKKGKVTAKKAGKATITAKVGKKKLRCKIIVKALKAETPKAEAPKAETPKVEASSDNGTKQDIFSVDKSSIELQVGRSAVIKVTSTSDASLEWDCDNIISGNWGKWQGDTCSLTITGETKGNAILTISREDTKKKLSIKIKVIQPVEKVSIMDSDKTIDLGPGEVRSIYASVSPYDADNLTLKWTSSNPKVVSVDSNGKVTGLSKGSAVITATASNGKNDKSQVTVHDVSIKVPYLPKTVSKYEFGNTLDSSCKVKKIEFEKTRNSSLSEVEALFFVKLWIYGEKTYDHNPTTSSSCEIGYKLYDKQGYVVKSGIFDSDSVSNGESFKSWTWLGDDLKEGDYELELLDVKY